MISRRHDHNLSALWPSPLIAATQVEPEGIFADIFDGIPNENLWGFAVGENQSIQDRRQPTRFVAKSSAPRPKNLRQFLQSLHPIADIGEVIESYTFHNGNVIVHIYLYTLADSKAK